MVYYPPGGGDMKQELLELLNELSTENLYVLRIAVSLLNAGLSEEEILCQIQIDR